LFLEWTQFGNDRLGDADALGKVRAEVHVMELALLREEGRSFASASLR
jgi:hypothetical protein